MTTLAVNLLFLATISLYSAAGVLFWSHLAGYRPDTVLAARLMAAGTALHAVHIVLFSWVLHVCPVEGIHFPLSVVAMLMAAAYLLGRRRSAIDAVGAVIAPLAVTTLLASRFVGGADFAPSARIKGVMLPVHVTMNLLGIALFSFASASAILYLLQERRLKDKTQAGLLRRLPPLDALDRAEHRFLIAGFPLLTLGVVTGTVWATKLDAVTVSDWARAGLGYAMWAVFAAVLLLRAAMGWRGRRAAYGTLAGFGFALLILAFYLLRQPPETPSLGTQVWRVLSSGAV